MNVAQPEDGEESDPPPKKTPEGANGVEGVVVTSDDPIERSDVTQTLSAPVHQSRDLGTLATAVLALVSAIIGGSITAGASVWVANMTVRAQQQQSVDEYRRTNREKIYQDMLAQMSALDGVMQDLNLQAAAIAANAQLGRPPADKTQIYKPLYERWEPEYAKFAAAISNAELVSSHHIIDVSRALRDAYSRDFYVIVTPELLPPGTPTSIVEQFLRMASLSDIAPDYDPSLKGKSRYELKVLFVSDAKDDLAFND